MSASEHADRDNMDLSSPCDHRPQDQPYAGDIEDLWLQETIHLEDINTVAEFIKMLQSASLDDPSLGMSSEALERL